MAAAAAAVAVTGGIVVCPRVECKFGKLSTVSMAPYNVVVVVELLLLIPFVVPFVVPVVMLPAMLPVVPLLLRPLVRLEGLVFNDVAY